MPDTLRVVYRAEGMSIFDWEFFGTQDSYSTIADQSLYLGSGSSTFWGLRKIESLNYWSTIPPFWLEPTPASHFWGMDA